MSEQVSTTQQDDLITRRASARRGSNHDPRLDASTLVRSRLGQERLQLLLRVDNWRNVLYLAADWGVVAGAIAIAETVGGAWVTLAAILVIGSRQRALMNLVHQASHRQLFASRFVNDWAGRIFTSLPLGMSLYAYKKSHFAHHGHLWQPDRDPKFLRYKTLGLVNAPRRRDLFIARHLLAPLILRHVPFNLKAALAAGDADRREHLGRLTFFAVVLAAVYLTGFERQFLVYWVVPYLTVFQVVRYWAEAAEHAGLRSPDPWMATRNWTAMPAVRWLLAPHSDSYHLAHHIVAGVPHYRLRRLHRELMTVPEYAQGHHCDGFLFPRRPDAPSVIIDMCWPDRLRARASVGDPAVAE
jgi:fatty acid desaturase